MGGTAIPARGGAGTRRSPALRSQQRPSWEERACLFSPRTGRGGAGSRVSKVSPFVIPAQSHPLHPHPRLHSRTWGGWGSCPGRNLLNREEARVTAELLGRSRALPSLTPNIPEGWSTGPPGPYPETPWGPWASRGRSGEEGGKSGGGGVGVLVFEWDKMGFGWVCFLFFFFLFLGGDPGLFCPGV